MAGMTMARKRDTRVSLNDQVVTEIWAWLGRRRLSQAALARELGEHHTWIRRRLNGRQVLDLAEIERIADVFTIDVLDLFPPRKGGSNERSRRKPNDRRRPRRISQRRRPVTANVPSSLRRPVPVRPSVSMLSAA